MITSRELLLTCNEVTIKEIGDYLCLVIRDINEQIRQKAPFSIPASWKRGDTMFSLDHTNDFSDEHLYNVFKNNRSSIARLIKYSLSQNILGFSISISLKFIETPVLEKKTLMCSETESNIDTDPFMDVFEPLPIFGTLLCTCNFS